MEAIKWNKKRKRTHARFNGLHNWAYLNIVSACRDKFIETNGDPCKTRKWSTTLILNWRKPLNIGLSIKIGRLVECFQCLHLLTKFHRHPLSGICQWHWNRAFSLMWPTAMRIYRNKGKFCAHEEVRLPQDWFETPTWPSFFGGDTNMTNVTVVMWKSSLTPAQVYYF